jgi:hypothetical protein
VYGLRVCTDCVCVRAVTGFGIREVGLCRICWPAVIYLSLSADDVMQHSPLTSRIAFLISFLVGEFSVSE